MTSIFTDQNFTPNYFTHELDYTNKKLDKLNPEQKKKSAESITQGVLGGTCGGGAALFDRSLQAIVVPGSFLAFQFVHRGFEFAGASLDLGFSISDKVGFEKWSKRINSIDTQGEGTLQPVSALVNKKHEQLRSHFNWGLTRSIVRFVWGGTLSALLLGLQIATIASGILFPPAGAAILVSGIILGIVATSIASLCISAKKMPNTYRLHFKGLTAKLLWSKIKRGFVKAFTCRNIRKLTRQTVASGQKLTHLNRLALNFATAYQVETCPEKQRELEISLRQVNAKIDATKQEWSKNRNKLKGLKRRTKKLDQVIERREKAVRHAQMADFTQYLNPQTTYHKAPVPKGEVRKLVKLLDPKKSSPESLALLKSENVELRQVVEFIAARNVEHPGTQKFLKKWIFKKQPEAVSLEQVKNYQSAAQDPLQIKRIVSDLMSHDPNLEGEKAHQLLEVGLKLDLEKFRKYSDPKEKAKLLSKALKRYLCFNESDLREHFRLQRKKK